jgi:TrmH family RNA methyltransferase
MTKNELKYYSSLLTKKYRDEEKKFLVEGIKIVREGIKDNTWRNRCESVIVSHNFANENSDLIDELGLFKITPEEVSEQELKKLSDTVTPQGIVAVFKMPSVNRKLQEKITSGLIVALENISDPGNVGTIIRNCDWFGINDIVLSPGCADIYNPKTIRSGMGSLFHLNIYDDVEFANYFRELKSSGVKILCADLNGSNIFQYQLQEPSIIVFANEANGPSQEILSLSDDIITITKLGNAESLNVANASAVILAELTKRV